MDIENQNIHRILASALIDVTRDYLSGIDYCFMALLSLAAVIFMFVMKKYLTYIDM